MKISILIIFFFLFVIANAFAQTATAPVLGDGSSGNPYQIATLENLYWISASNTVVPSPTHLTRWASTTYYKQTADIDASASSGWDSGNGWTAIGNITTNFTGSYDGQNHTISGLYINRPTTNYIGLFGDCAGGVTITNLGVTNINITGSFYVGALVAAIEGDGIITNCYSSGNVYGYNSAHVGGLVGNTSTTTISNSHSSCDVTATGTTQGVYIGGFAGVYTSYSAGSNTLNDCYATGNVKGIANSFCLGGFVGNLNGSGTVNNCYSTGDVGSAGVTGGYAYGGFVGYMHSNTIRNCFSTGDVIYANQWTGGFVGYSEASSTITNCYSTGSITRQTGGSQTTFGGFIGYSQSTISNCYSTGGVTYTETTNPTDKGFVGTDVSGTYSNNFFDSETSSQSTGTGASAATTANMKTQSTFTDAGWDFIVETTNGTNDYWEMNSGFNNGYPILSWQAVNVTGITTTPNIVSNSNIGFTAESGSISLGFVEMNATPQYLPGGSVTINKYWEISDITGGNVKLRLYYLPSLTASFTGTPKIFHYNGSSWEELPTDPEVTDGNLKYVETTNYYSSFSPVTVWDNASALPVEMASFSAKTVNDKVNLTWQTATEVNNHGFEVQRATVILNEVRNLSWQKIGFVAGAGNSNSPKSYSFTDQPTGGTRFSYRIKQIDNNGKYKYYDAITVNLTTNQKAELLGNYPNPFNPSTSIKFYIPNNSDVTIKIFDMLGREVTTLINKQTEAGYHIVYWNGEDRFGNSAASGVYIYRLTAGSFVQIKKMALMK